MQWQSMLRGKDPHLRVHLMGIGGAGLSGIAIVLREMGLRVTGSDLHPSAVTAQLERLAIPVIPRQTEDHLRQLPAARLPHVILISSAVPADNPELRAARQRRIPVCTREEFLPLLLEDRRLIAVAGTHGKSTTTAMTVHILKAAGLACGYLFGAPHPHLASAAAGEHPLFVIEADEYGGMFLGLSPDTAVVTSLEWDHPDRYPTEGSLTAAFRRFLAGVRHDGTIIYNRDDANLRALHRERPGPPRTVSFGTAPGSDWRVHLPTPDQTQSTTFSLHRAVDGARHPVAIAVSGAHNMLNAAAAWLAAVSQGIAPGIAAQALRRYAPLRRRFEVRGRFGDVTVIDDYAHHPSAVQAVLRTARAHHGEGRLWAVFQPHTFSRIQALLPAFQEAFTEADRVVIMPTFAARETPRQGMDGSALAASLPHPHVTHTRSLDATLELLTAQTRAGDVVLVMGAGDCWRVSEGLMRDLAPGAAERE